MLHQVLNPDSIRELHSVVGLAVAYPYSNCNGNDQYSKDDSCYNPKQDP